MTTNTTTLCAFLYALFGAKYYSALSFSVNAPLSGTAAAAVASRNEWQPGVEIELPNIEALFDRIQMASPLAKLVMEGNSMRGFEVIDDSSHFPGLKWKKVEDNKRKTVHQIHKMDSFQNVRTPLLRFRSSISGPCLPERFSNMIMDLKERQKWDDQVANVEELYPITDLDAINDILDEDRFGKCKRIGVGYTQTKQGIISPREQLIIGGMQEYKDGSAILWGTEMEEERHNHLLPAGQRHTRAKSHLFAATLVPTGPDSFDVEYLLQMDVGGGIPQFMTTPALTDAVKKLFEHAKGYFEGGEGSELDLFLKSQEEELSGTVEFLDIVEDFSAADNGSIEDGEDVDLSDAHHRYHAMKSIKSLFFTP